MPYAPALVDTSKLESYLDQLIESIEELKQKAEDGNEEESDGDVLVRNKQEYVRARASLDQTLRQAIAATNAALSEDQAAQDTIPEHLKGALEQEIEKIKRDLQELTDRQAELLAEYPPKLE